MRCVQKMEKVVVKCLSLYLHQHKLINQQKRGFLTKKFTSTNHLETLNDWTLTQDDGSSFTAALIDVAKAFDSVSHPRLLYKLWSYGITDNVLA